MTPTQYFYSTLSTYAATLIGSIASSAKDAPQVSNAIAVIGGSLSFILTLKTLYEYRQLNKKMADEDKAKIALLHQCENDLSKEDERISMQKIICAEMREKIACLQTAQQKNVAASVAGNLAQPVLPKGVATQFMRGVVHGKEREELFSEKAAQYQA